MFQPTKEWVNKVNLSSFELENFFKIRACVISARKAKQLDATTMFTYSYANTPLGQSERAYYLSYFIKCFFRYTILHATFSKCDFKSRVKIPEVLRRFLVAKTSLFRTKDPRPHHLTQFVNFQRKS